MMLLGVNVDHVATIRQARRVVYPSPIEAAKASIKGGADQITIHLREDRRHIVDDDVYSMKEKIDVPLNLEMAVADDIVEIACKIKPATCTLVPEKRQELTTEGGLDVIGSLNKIKLVTKRLVDSGISVSLFIDPDIDQVDASMETGASAIEFHTGSYCDATEEIVLNKEIERLKNAVAYAKNKNLKICAGHGINYKNASKIVALLPDVVEYNIGHAIVSRAIMTGIENAVKEMKNLLLNPSK